MRGCVVKGVGLGGVMVGLWKEVDGVCVFKSVFLCVSVC